MMPSIPTYRRLDLPQLFAKGIPILLLIWLVATAAWAEQPIEIRLAVQPGEVFVQTLEIEWAAERESGKNAYRIGATLRTEVLDRASQAGGVWTAVTYERLWFRRLAGRVSWPDYDSAETSAAPPAHLPYEGTGLTAVLGQRLQVELDAGGRVVDIEDWQGACQAMIASFRTMEEISEAEESQIRADFTRSVLAQVLALSKAPYPDRAVRRGDGWSETRLSEIGSAETTYTLADYDTERVQIVVASQVAEAGASDGPASRIVLDQRSGWLLSSTVVQRQGRLTRTVEISSEPGTP